MQHAVATRAFAGLGGRELLLNLAQQRSLRRRQRPVRRSEIGEPGGVRLRGGFDHEVGFWGAVKGRSGLGSDQPDFGKIGAVAGGVAGEQAQAFDLGVGTDVEIREGGAARAVAFAVGEEGLGGEETGFVG